MDKVHKMDIVSVLLSICASCFCWFIYGTCTVTYFPNQEKKKNSVALVRERTIQKFKFDKIKISVIKCLSYSSE